MRLEHSRRHDVNQAGSVMPAAMSRVRVRYVVWYAFGSEFVGPKPIVLLVRRDKREVPGTCSRGIKYVTGGGRASCRELAVSPTPPVLSVVACADACDSTTVTPPIKISTPCAANRPRKHAHK